MAKWERFDGLSTNVYHRCKKVILLISTLYRATQVQKYQFWDSNFLALYIDLVQHLVFVPSPLKSFESNVLHFISIFTKTFLTHQREAQFPLVTFHPLILRSSSSESLRFMMFKCSRQRIQVYYKRRQSIWAVLICEMFNIILLWAIRSSQADLTSFNDSNWKSVARETNLKKGTIFQEHEAHWNKEHAGDCSGSLSCSRRFQFHRLQDKNGLKKMRSKF